MIKIKDIYLEFGNYRTGANTMAVLIRTAREYFIS